MKNHRISEILYWVIAVISIYEAFARWETNRERALLFYWICSFICFYGSYLEDIIGKNLIKGKFIRMNPTDLVIIICLLLSAFFSGMEIAFVSSNRIYLEIEKLQAGVNLKVLKKITQNPSRFIASMLLGNNIALVCMVFLWEIEFYSFFSKYIT